MLPTLRYAGVASPPTPPPAPAASGTAPRGGPNPNASASADVLRICTPRPASDSDTASSSGSASGSDHDWDVSEAGFHALLGTGSMDLDIEAAINTINDCETTAAPALPARTTPTTTTATATATTAKATRKRSRAGSVDYLPTPSPSQLLFSCSFLPSPATMRGLQLEATAALGTDDIANAVATVPDVLHGALEEHAFEHLCDHSLAVTDAASPNGKPAPAPAPAQRAAKRPCQAAPGVAVAKPKPVAKTKRTRKVRRKAKGAPDARQPPTPRVFDVETVSVEDLAAIFAADPAMMQLAKALCKAPVVLNENQALKKKRAKKIPVNEAKKDAKYYERRRKNTAAAKRNRDLKRDKRLLEKEQARARSAIMSKLPRTDKAPAAAAAAAVAL